MNEPHVYDMIVVGGVPGGYTAALYAARAGLDTLVLEKLSAGRQMALTEQIDNYPGFEDGIDGFTLAEKMQQQAERFGAQSEYAQVERMDLAASPKVLETSEGTAAADAMLLSRIAKKVIMVHRRDTLRATKIYHAPLMQAENLTFYWNSVVTELLHTDSLTGITLKNVHTGEQTSLPCDGVFISVGRKPATELVQGQLELDPNGYILADETTKTNLPGVYAVGDVRTKPLRQVVTAVADGATAVHMAEAYLSGGE